MKLLARLRPSGHVAQFLSIIAICAGLLGINIGSLNPGLAANEVALPSAASSFESLWNTPIEAPLHVTRLIVAAVSPTTNSAVSRLPNVLLAVTMVVVLCVLIKKWYGYRLALFGLPLLVTAAWFLHVGRLGSSDILYPFGMALLMALAAYWHAKEWRPRILYGSALAVAVLAYIPGMIWLLIVVGLFERKTIITNIKKYRKQAAGAGMLLLVLLTPLLYGLAKAPGIGKQLIGFGADVPSVKTFALDYVQSWQYLFIGGYDTPIYNVGRMPLIDVFITLAFIVGLYVYAKHPKATRTKQLTGLWLVSTALIALGGPVSISIVMPIVLILAVGGIGYLLHVWLKTFPRNPYARAFGIGMLSLVVAFAVAYNLHNYFVAWPNTPAVKASFTRQV